MTLFRRRPTPPPPAALGATDAELSRLNAPAVDVDRARHVALALLYGSRR